MPNIKSAIKRVRVTEKKNLENKAFKSKLATYIKKFKANLATDVASAEKDYSAVSSFLDSAVSKNIIHASASNRRKAHFAKLLDDAKKAK